MHKRNKSNYNDLTKFISNPSLLVSEPSGHNFNFATISTPIVSSVQESLIGNPESSSPLSKTKKLTNLSKYTSEKKIGFQGHSIEDFEVGKKLGKGNFGDVYLVRHNLLGFIFALKIISKQVVK